MKDIKDMKPNCSVGFGGANKAVEDLGEDVYSLREEVEQHRATINILRQESRRNAREDT